MRSSSHVNFVHPAPQASRVRTPAEKTVAGIAVGPAIRMAYRLAHSEPMLEITVQELCDYRRRRNKKHDANDAEQLSAQQGGQ